MSLLLAINSSQDLLLVAVGSEMVAEAGIATAKVTPFVATEEVGGYGQKITFKWSRDAKAKAIGSQSKLGAGKTTVRISEEMFEPYYIFPLKSDPSYPISKRIIASGAKAEARSGIAGIVCDSVIMAYGSACVASSGRCKLKKVNNPTDQEFDLILRMMGWK